ncbi:MULTISPECIES: dTDP-4-dehydrorhamnose 3,5-epimerase [Enterobacter cloacae complex]|uniref:dTDP-4-dehydrorhamnose 3,5-epimerase n=1 Tax=Enterobacter cloacae complex TaxID=354276 RepID=UPI0007996B7F|nr:dTDP-4-dehydrorhamnose 3,5-epimerase [Enterobacter hormaechei]MBA7867312.1 dTDP-4-dehydrorhamnose 3,5-epimerase [Enterobacter hormaechei]MBJ6527429.1 dTDP-4-dehydrorhamnose 3,5-epimerase [Enterobacter hormaechei]MBT1922550.1 dTDP-4-dehydrorhamnose 3,5-epimerase [Enterobacter hormaechei subsp. hoffmannii]MBT1927293.1 dTDP-4-dehydrorhamnose 3,5-epimerase [Enterobacter hormaechei subsp. hoffmannii]MBT1951222.1 dTDP-4-dehydrorhamnose 3,5-epimerase [Enterobacter hormaechei subsp. hoffmannii]
MNVIQTPLKDCVIIEPEVFGDSRGFFLEAWHKEKYEDAGIKGTFVQDNRSRSSRNVLRGLHFQKTKPQGKLVSVISGEVYDVAVDLRQDSDTFGQYVGVLLSGEKNNQLYVPPGFAHGFCVLSDYADFHYKCTDFYDPKDEGGIIWNDPDIAIDWPITSPLLSEKDIKLITLAEYKKTL